MNVNHIVVGLGNPGPRYAFTRHNIGFIALDVLVQDFRQSWASSKTGLGKLINAETSEIEIEGTRALLLKPQTYMNLSGESVAKLYQKHRHLRDCPLTVLHDEVDIDFGKIRVKFGGGDAGHNGLKSIRAALGHGDYNRVRLGVGRPPREIPIPVADYVLQSFSKDAEDGLMKMLGKTESILKALFKNDLKLAQVEASKI